MFLLVGQIDFLFKVMNEYTRSMGSKSSGNGGANANTMNANEYGIERVVYKPGDVELDCRMVGDSAVVNQIRPTNNAQIKKPI